MAAGRGATRIDGVGRTYDQTGKVCAVLTATRIGAKVTTMVDHVSRVTEIVGTSPDSLDAAIRNGIDRAAQPLDGLDWFEVTEIRGHLADGAVAHFQVSLKVGFRLDEPG